MATANNSECYLIRGVELDSDHDNVLIPLGSTATRANYFLDNTRYPNKTHYTNLSYIRPERGTIRVNGAITAADYNSNYVMFRNQSHENKWFYGFVSRVEYVSDNAFDILFELDYINTYMEQLSIQASHIVRAHQATDNFGDNIEAEPFSPTIKNVESKTIGGNEADVNYYVHAESSQTGSPTIQKARHFFTDDKFGVWAWNNDYLSNMITDGPDSPFFNMSLSTGYYAFYRSTPNGFNHFADKILSFYSEGTLERVYRAGMCPNIGGEYDTETDRLKSWDASTRVIADNSWGLPTKVDGYTPHNKKCLTSQFNYLELTGDTQENLYYELSNRSDHGIQLFGVCCFWGAMPTLLVMPKHYDTYGTYNDTPYYDGQLDNTPGDITPSTLMNHSVTFSNYPEFELSIDGYTQWHSTREQTARIFSAIGGLLGGGSSSPAAASPAYSGGKEIISKDLAGSHMAERGAVQKSNAIGLSGAVMGAAANSVAGSFTASGKKITSAVNCIPQLTYTIGVQVRLMQCIRNQIEKIDSFFDRYGYAINKCAIPNINARHYFTYLQLQNPDVGGDMPDEARQAFRDMLSRGTTFFNTNGRIGVYRPATQNTPNN